MTGRRIQTGYSDVPFEVLNNDFVLDGYEFIGWNTKADGSGTMVQPNQMIDVQKDTTLYAQWKHVYDYMKLVRVGDVKVESNTAAFGVNSQLHTPTFFNLTNASSFELVLKFTTSDDIITQQVLFRQSAAYEYGLYIENSKLLYRATNTVSNTMLSPNTTYYMKVVKNCNAVDIYLLNSNGLFNKVMSFSTSFNVVNQYFTFGFNKKYTYKYQTTQPKTVLMYRNPAYTTYEDRWITYEQYCAYGDRNGRKYSYSDKLKHATASKYDKKGNANSNGCGYWYLDYPVYHEASGPYYETVQQTVTVTEQREYYNFKGIMDFNESYFVLDGLKYKLRA